MVERSPVKQNLPERYEDVLSRIRSHSLAAGRSPDDIKIIAITKTHPADIVRQAIDLGMREFGENRVQEAESKIGDIGRVRVRWHLVGHLQANKARRAVQLFDVIHSVDSESLARRLERLCAEEDRSTMPVLIQVELAGEKTKSGLPEEKVEEVAAVIKSCKRLEFLGLMTLPPFFEDAEQVRPFFRRLRELRDELARKGYFGDSSGELSMGMTHDFEIAIEEGATMLRIGTAIFGEREKNDP